ncbi:virulence factor TspB C-terminal domain-related protein [Acinetobacter baumannii]|uniref:virulence factor TspB C-terminal domain-related protein n=1 Tax=Acinetobacter baumannii TaxID=470 RepID=UPI002449E26E|nr:virulence factor TspB C-terminal domain-related protein [Acinetobacter baumannii]MDH2526559.1 virulence factor TspB C-terminal domain-related protein [Acinetobacter baumannii]
MDCNKKSLKRNFRQLYMCFLSLVIAISPVFASTSTTYTYNSRHKIDQGWKFVRSIASSNAIKRNVYGLVISTAVIYSGDKLITEYKAGTFDASIENLKHAVASMYAAGISATGKLQELFNTLATKYTCDTNNNCQTTANIYSSQFTDGTYFKSQNGIKKYYSINDFAKQEIFDSNAHTSFSIVGFQEGTNALENLLAMPTGGGALTLLVHVNCKVDGSWCGLDNSGNIKTEDIISSTVVIIKPNDEPSSIPISGSQVTSDQIAQDVILDNTQEQAQNILNTCFATGCAEIPIIANPASNVPISSTVGGVSVPDYPAPDVIYNPKTGEWIDSKTGENITDVITDTSTDTSVKPVDYSPFCEWASSACEFFDYVKTKVNSAENYFQDDPDNNTELDLGAVTPVDIDTDIKFNGQCPTPMIYEFSYGDQKQSFGIQDFTPFCSMLNDILKPISIAVSSFVAVLIIAGVRTNE